MQIRKFEMDRDLPVLEGFLRNQRENVGADIIRPVILQQNHIGKADIPRFRR